MIHDPKEKVRTNANVSVSLLKRKADSKAAGRVASISKDKVANSNNVRKARAMAGHNTAAVRDQILKTEDHRVVAPGKGRVDSKVAATGLTGAEIPAVHKVAAEKIK